MKKNEVRNQDKKNYVNFIKNHKQYLYHIAIAIVRNDEDAGEAISETITKAYANLNQLKEKKYLKTWITRILINECRKIIRQKEKVVSLELHKETIQSISYDEKKEETMDLKQAIDKLKKEQKEVILLYYYNDFATKDISKLLEIPEGTVKSRLNTARKFLYKILDTERREENGK